MSTVIIIQARMGSTRLPGKVLREVLGRPLLAHQTERLQRVCHADQLVVATTEDAGDDAIVDWCRANGVAWFRGSTDDVLGRYMGAARQHQASAVVRVTADCPLIDPEIVDRVIEKFDTSDFDYVANTLERTFPRGLDCEVVSAATLETAHEEAVEPYEREHVTPFIYHRPERFRLGSLVHERDLSRYRWTVDTAEDFELIEKMIASLVPTHPQFSMADCVALMEAEPALELINANVEQKLVVE